MPRTARSASSASGSRSDAWRIALLFAALTLVFTWPLARGLARDVPGDFGDPLLNVWILAWGATHVGPGWWSANIYFPHPLALAYSEHLLPEALQSLPVYAATRNAILAYNLVFLTTFVLSGLGMFLFVRELTGNRAAAIVAGIAFAFAPYRVPSMPHLQVLSAQWMPFALLGFRRYFATGRLAPLAWGSLAWLAENLSCGYYLLFFSPVVAAYLAWEMTTRSLWRDKRILGWLMAAGAVVVAITLMFLYPYTQARKLGFSPRSIEETSRFSADVFAYLTADPNLRVWGSIVQAWPKAEGTLFPGFAIVVLAAIAIVARASGARVRGTRSAMHTALTVAFAACLLVLLALLCGWTLRGPIQITSAPRVALIAAALGAALLAVSADARSSTRGFFASPAGFFALVAVLAVITSWGPTIEARGRTVVGTNLYAAFYHFVPGFDGLRVPARFAMVVVFALAVLAGLGVAAISERPLATGVAITASMIIFIESFAVPIPINQNSTDYAQPGLAPLPASISAVDAPPVYAFVAQLPPGSALIELPFGEPAFDVRYMFYSTRHWRPLVNGYSGGGPVGYEFVTESLKDALIRPDRAWQALADTGATHAIVHEALYAGDRGPQISGWLRSMGAREIASFGADRIFQIR